MFLFSVQNNFYTEFIILYIEIREKESETKINSQCHVSGWFPGLQNLIFFFFFSFSLRIYRGESLAIVFRQK